MLKSILLLTIALSSSLAFAGNGYHCTAYSNDGANRKLPFSIGLSDKHTGAEYHVGYSNQKGGTASLTYSFRADVTVTNKSMDVLMDDVGQLGTWADETMEESVWVDVTAPATGYMKLKKVRRSAIGAGYVGVALLPFVNDGKPVAMNCQKSAPSRDQCGWFFCL